MNTTLLTRRVAEIIDKDNLKKLIGSKKRLRIKLGIDPTRPDIHLGHAVPLWKLREFQDNGHTAVFIIGDWTAQIGDPSGKDESRTALTHKQTKENAKTFLKQAYKILDKNKTEVYYNSDWFKKFRFADIQELLSKVSVFKLLSHETFRLRLDNDQPFFAHELLYPLLQGYDSVAVKADVELGAMEQKFNLLMGRKIQRAYGQKEQDVMMVEYLIGLDGKEKMSKSLNNYISLQDSAEEMFGKIMSMPDDLIPHYFELCTMVSEDEIRSIKNSLSKEKINPKQVKAKLGREIVSIYHSSKDAVRAEDVFEKKFGKKEGKIQADKTLKLSVLKNIKTFDELLVVSNLASSKSDARRKIQEGAVDVNGVKVADPKSQHELKKNDLIRLGKRFLRIK